MQEQYKVYGYRWVNLIMYTVVTFMAGMGFMAMAPMLEMMAERWMVGFGAVSLFMSVIGLFQVLLSIPTGFLAGRVGFKWPVAIGATLLAAGYLLRATAPSYAMFMVYTIIAGLGWGIIWSPVGILAATWFPHKEIGLANSLWAVGFLAGQAFGSLTAVPFFMNMGWTSMWLTYGIISVVIAALAWFLLRPKPALPPEPRPPFPPAGIGPGIKQTMNRSNIALQYTVFAAVGSLAVAPAVAPVALIAKGIAPPTAGIIAGLSLVGGVFGSLILPPFAFARQKARPTLLVCAIIAPLAFIALFYLPVAAAIVFSLLFGFTGAAVLGISMGVGQMQPGVNPGNAGVLSGVFLTAIGLGAAIFPLVVGQMVDATGPLGGAWLLAALAAVSIIIVALFVPEPKAPAGPPDHP